MNPSTLYAPPADRAVVILHEKFTGGIGQIAIIAPTPDPGISFVGIIDADGKSWRFIKGPAKVKSGRVWLWLYKHDPCWPLLTTHIRPKDCLTSTLCNSPDEFIDLISSDGLPQASAKVNLKKPAHPKGFFRLLGELALSLVEVSWHLIVSGDFRAFCKAYKPAMQAKLKRESEGRK